MRYSALYHCLLGLAICGCSSCHRVSASRVTPSNNATARRESPVASTVEVSLNHVFVTLDSATFTALAASPFLADTFSGFDRRTVTALYLYGQHTYVEVFARRAAQVGMSGLALGVEERGGIEHVASQLRNATGRNVFRSTKRGELGERSYDWFYQAIVIYPDSLVPIFTWVMEYHPEYFAVVHGDSLAPVRDSADISRRRYLARRFRPDLMMRDVVGITLAVGDPHGDRLLTELSSHGWHVERMPGSPITGTARGPGAEIVIVPPARDGSLGIQELRFNLARAPSSEVTYRIGRTVLLLSPDGTARWELFRRD